MRFYWPIAKVDAEQHMVWGYASTEVEDEQGERVSRDALAAALDDYMQFANIREMHQPSAVGIATTAEIDDVGLYVGAKIVDDDAWLKVVEGVYKGFSIGGRVTARDPADRRVITGLSLTEISVVDRPANPEAVFDCWKLSTVSEPGGTPVNSANQTRTPVQIWDCGVAGHRHAGKGEAMRCIDGRGTLPVEPGNGPDAGADPQRTPQPDGTVRYADPGYLADRRQRYPLDSERHIRAAWAYIHQAPNARRYSTAELAEVKARIVAAWRAAIDHNGPPAAVHDVADPGDVAHKGMAETAPLARVIADLDWLEERIATETPVATDELPDPETLLDMVAVLRAYVEAASAGNANDADADDADTVDAPGAPEIAAIAAARTLRKRRPQAGHLAVGLAKLTGEIVPRLDALQAQVDAIARMPLPAQAAARGLSAVSKYEDGGVTAPPAGDVVAALARMSEDERTLTLIKAAHANPITPLCRTTR